MMNELLNLHIAFDRTLSMVFAGTAIFPVSTSLVML
jgi:hypothetical protein